MGGAVEARWSGAERRAVRSVEEQQSRVTAAAVAPRPVSVPIAESQGLMCAEDVVTEQPMPGFDQAAIDGYAVRSVDVMVAGEGQVRDRAAGDGCHRSGRPRPVGCNPSRRPAFRPARRCPPEADAVLPLRWTDSKGEPGSGAARGALGRLRAPHRRRRPTRRRGGARRRDHRLGPGRPAGGGRTRARPSAPQAAGRRDERRRGTGGHLPDFPGQRPGVRRQLLCAGRRGRRRRGHPGRDRRQRKGPARDRRESSSTAPRCW